MTPKLFKTLLIAVPSVMAGTIIIVPTAIAVAEANHEDPVPPTPPDPPVPPVEMVDITFNAVEGVIESTGQKTFTLTVESGSTWSLLSKPEAVWDDNIHFFDFWSLDGQTKVDDDHIFNSNETVYAVYTICEHEFDSYSVTEYETSDGSVRRRVWGHCSKCGETIELTDKQLKKLEGCVLVKDGDTFRLSDSLSYEVQYATSTSVDIYLIYGTYILVGNRIGSVVAANLHGVHDSSGKMISSLDCFNEDSQGSEKLWSAIGVELYCDNMILEGKSDADITWQGGIQCNHMVCKHCLITGAQAAYCDTCTFLNCEFDSTNVISTDRSNTDYSVFLYNRYATFHDCNFKSVGKAIKIYSHGTVQNNSYEFLRCSFSITERINPKACINVDSSHQTSASKYQVYVSECKQISGYQSEPIYEDVGGYTDFYDYPRP